MLPKAEPWPLAERLRREFETRSGFFSPGHPLDAYAAILARLRVQRFAEFVRAVKQGASAARLAATVLERHERRTKSGTKMGIVNLSDQSGQYEAILFQEGLDQYRESSGERCLPCSLACKPILTARMCGPALFPSNLWTSAASRIGTGFGFFCATNIRWTRSPAGLRARGDGEVSLVLLTNSGEVEIKLPGKFSVSPQVAGALKAIPGIVAVEHL